MVTDEKGSTCESRQPPAKEKSWSFWFKACGVGKSHTTRGQKCSKWDSRNILEATWPTEARSVQNEVPGTFWKPLGHRRPEQFNISLQTPSGSHMANGGQNTSPCPGLGGPAANKWTPAYTAKAGRRPPAPPIPHPSRGGQNNSTSRVALGRNFGVTLRMPRPRPRAARRHRP